MGEESACPVYLYKIVSPENWSESLLRNQFVPSSLDTDFIHLATVAQLPQIVQKFWRYKDHIILKLLSNKLTGRLVYEANPGGTNKYYHLYEGSIPLEAIVDITVHAISQ
jgi:uncharacterized protein (DUF952 family)